MSANQKPVVDITATVTPTDGPGERCKTEPRPPQTRMGKEQALALVGAVLLSALSVVVAHHHAKRLR